ncbi:hypothetical protein TcCL_Unassigned05015, partial [Trypanosoma cruzi]
GGGGSVLCESVTCIGFSGLLSFGTESFPELRAISSIAATHNNGQQHRASTSRAHSRRHVVIIVSVVVQWCGADLHSEGHGEQQGRREVRQTHTEGTPHEERAAARHAPYAAHHARQTPRPQHQHTDGGGRSKQERHTRLHRMHTRRERSVVSATLTEGTHRHKRRCSAYSNTKAK